jgi:hypothetical protein
MSNSNHNTNHKDYNITAADQIVGEYLIYRGFTQSFRSLEAEKARDKTKHFESSRIIDAVFGYLHGYEIEQFISLWDFLSKRFFFHLDGEHLGYSLSLKSDLLKYYLVHAFKANKKDKITEFFSMFSHEILAEGADYVAGNLRAWFVLPYMDEPEKDTEFTVYFTTRWSDSLRTTLGNFLSIVMASAPPPKLLLLEKWFHSEAQTEMRSQLSVSSKKVDALLARLEKAEERISQLRAVVKDLVLHVQKTSVIANQPSTSASALTRSAGQSSGLFETDEEFDYKRDKVSSKPTILVV